MAETTNLFRAFYQGTLLTRDNTIDGGEPVEITEVAPTVLKTQDSDTSEIESRIKHMENLTFLYLLLNKNSYIISTGANKKWDF